MLWILGVGVPVSAHRAQEFGVVKGASCLSGLMLLWSMKLCSQPCVGVNGTVFTGVTAMPVTLPSCL